PAGKNLLDVKRQGEKDGLDQVYFQVGDRHYVAEGDGLNLSGLKQGVFQSAEVILNGRSELATVRVVDDEVNTAWEGVKHVGLASAALLTGGLVGSGMLAGRTAYVAAPAIIGSTGQGMKAIEAGMTAVKAGMKPMNEGVELSIGAVQKIFSSAPPNQGMLDKIFGGVDKVTSLPQRTREITTGLDLVRGGAAKAQEGLALTDQGMAHFNASAEAAKNSVHGFKQAAKVAGIGLAVAGTVAIGGAIYGAARGSEANALGAFKGRKLD
ncbi:MAG: hypothetical protein CVV27_13860, partial [Candidatus Melainabacteria bacterium HGW-Melainabacteria-1]